ncbi:MAG TPA: hypothetical protein VLS90_20510 [Thermodesulfobacteriota bacterium]|nr:hypothetical protein [Thermodesulfobacteriota bacterium]
MERMNAFGWEIEFNRESTLKAHASMERGGAEVCGCQGCRNWIRVRATVFPAEVVTVFETLGMALDRETEMGAPMEIVKGRFLYSGWFHFVGRLLSGPPAREHVAVIRPHGPVEGGSVERVIHRQVGPGFSIGMISRRDLLPKPFKNQEVVQLEFTVETPWVLEEPYSG